MKHYSEQEHKEFRRIHDEIIDWMCATKCEEFSDLLDYCQDNKKENWDSHICKNPGPYVKYAAAVKRHRKQKDRKQLEAVKAQP